MKKYLKIGAIFLGIAVVGVVGYIVTLQLFPKTVNESRDEIPVADTSQSQPQTPATPLPEQPPAPAPAKEPTGSFVGLVGHQASGDATLISAPDGMYIRLEDNFSVTNCPDLHVYVGSFDKQQQEVAVLKGTKGGQNYKLPANIDPASFDTVWIYCKRFATPFAKAKLSS